MSIDTYDSKRVSVTFALVPIEAGYDEDEFVTIEPVAASFTSKVGADGRVVRSKSNDPRVKITLKMMHTSPANSFLTTIHELDKSLPNGAGVAPFSMIDLNGTQLLVCGQSWITAPPNQSRGKEAKGIEWVLEGVVTTRVDGGN